MTTDATSIVVAPIPENYTYTATIGDKELTIETGRLARLAGGAVTVRMGDTMVLATATMAKQARDGIDFFPLSVEYEERLYAAGRIPGSFFRREGRPAEAGILICRLIDRPLRPLFPDDLRNDVQVIITALSHDQINEIDMLAINAASAALMHQRRAVRRPGRRGARRPDRRRSGGQPDDPGDGIQRPRPAHRRHQGRHRHGGMRRQRSGRSHHGRGAASSATSRCRTSSTCRTRCAKRLASPRSRLSQVRPEQSVQQPCARRRWAAACRTCYRRQALEKAERNAAHRRAGRRSCGADAEPSAT